MDPLSAVASAIALSQASGAIGKGVKFLHSLRHIPAEFCDVVNQLTALQAVLQQVTAALEGYEDDKSDASKPATDLSGMLVLENDLKQTTGELEALCERLRATDRRPTQDGKLHISKSKWIREKRNMEKIRTKAIAARDNLTLCFGALISSQASRQTKAVIDIHSLLVSTSHSLSEETKKVFTMTQESQASIQEIREFMCHFQANPLNLQQVLETTLKASTGQADSTRSLPYKEPTPNRNMSIEATIKRGCSTHCSCQCHRHTRIQSPKWIRSVFGSLFLQYNSLPVLDTRACDNIYCHQLSTKSVRLRYIFPQWLMARAVYLAVSWHSLTGSGSDMHIHVPRVLQNEDAVNAIGHRDFVWLKKAITTKEILPTDITKGGITLLHESLYWNDLHVAQFFFEQGFSTKGVDVYGSTVAISARRKYVKLNLSQMSIIEELVTCDDLEDPTSTLLHDCLFGNDYNQLSFAITASPSDVNRLDHLGWSPMHLAILRGDSVALCMMLACPERNLQTQSYNGDSLLHMAAQLEKRSTEMVTLLLEAGANVNAGNGTGSASGRTPIIYAIGNPETLQLLLERGAAHTIEVVGGDSSRRLENPVTWASRYFYSFKYGCDFQYDWDQSLGILVGHGIDLDLPDSLGHTPLYWTIINRNAALLALLIRHGARIDVVYEYGWSILHFAAMYGNLGIFNVLINANIKGIQPNAQNTEGKSPMLIMVGRLLEFDDDRPPGVTVATYAEMLAFKQLLEDIHYRNKYGQAISDGTSLEPSNRVYDVDEADSEGSTVKSDQSFASTLALFGSVTSHGDLPTDSNQQDELGDLENSEDESVDEEFFDAGETLDVASSSG